METCHNQTSLFTDVVDVCLNSYSWNEIVILHDETAATGIWVSTLIDIILYILITVFQNSPFPSNLTNAVSLI